MIPDTSEIVITVGDRDITDHVVFSQTNFQVVGAAQPGTCQVTVRDPYSLPRPVQYYTQPWPMETPSTFEPPIFTPGKDLICLYIDGKKMWWGYLFTLEQGFVFPDDPEPKIVLHGVDLNILFDKLVMYNHLHETWYPDGGGTYKRYKEVGADGKVTGYIVSVPAETSDRDYIRAMLNDFDLNLVQPEIRWGQDVPSDSRIDEIGVINAGTTAATWTPPAAGTTLRAFFQDVSNNIVRSQPGSAIWYIDPEGYIVWKDIDNAIPEDPAFWAGVGDAEGCVPCKNLTITTDVSRLKNDVLIFSGTLDPTPQSTQDYLVFVHKTNNQSVNLFGRFQWSEVMGSDWIRNLMNARANKVLNQEGTPAMKADFTVYKPGLYPGQIIEIFSDAHTFYVFDPVFGLRVQDGINMPIRSVDMTFPTPDVVEYRVTCSFDTQDPWGLLLALKRPPTRGLVQPQFMVIDMSDPTRDYTYVEAQPMALVKEYPERGAGGIWQCSYAYVRGSLTVVVEGRRLTTVPEPTTNAPAGYLETNPDAGQFKTDATISQRVYVEYHVWHNLE